MVRSPSNPTTSPTGAFTLQNKGTQTNITFGSDAVYMYNITFNASLSNSIYGNSTTVQPKSYSVRYIIRAK